MSDARRFTDEEIRAILARAADRQEEAERAGPPPSGSLTLDELRAVGAEAGIDPAHVRAAALELYGGGEAPVASAAPAWHPAEVRRVPGARLDGRSWERTVALLREAFGVNGIATDFGGVREWCSSSLGGDTQVVRLRAEPDEEGVTLVLSRNLQALSSGPVVVGAIFVACAALIGLLGVLAGGPNVLPAVLLLLAFAVLFAGGGTLVGRWLADRRTAELRTVADRIQLLLERDQRR